MGREKGKIGTINVNNCSLEGRIISDFFLTFFFYINMYKFYK